MADYFNNSEVRENGILKFVLRFLAASIILAITAFLTPGFTISGFWPLLISAIVISILDYALSKVGLDVSPFGRGATGFVLSALVLYFTQFFVTGYNISLFAAFVGALIYGIVDAFIPGKSL
jgi:uncharacterized membrane protein YvlD (DUF360 family)